MFHIKHNLLYLRLNDGQAMIRYALKCTNGHSFDSWFQSASAFDKLQKTKMISCAICGILSVKKSTMAPQVNVSKTAKPSKKNVTRPLSGPASQAEQAVIEMRKWVEKNSENVGTDFASEARAIHEGSAPKRSIVGQARSDEAKALIEEGIPVAPLPWNDQKRN